MEIFYFLIISGFLQKLKIELSMANFGRYLVDTGHTALKKAGYARFRLPDNRLFDQLDSGNWSDNTGYPLQNLAITE